MTKQNPLAAAGVVHGAVVGIVGMLVADTLVHTVNSKSPAVVAVAVCGAADHAAAVAASTGQSKCLTGTVVGIGAAARIQEMEFLDAVVYAIQTAYYFA